MLVGIWSIFHNLGVEEVEFGVSGVNEVDFLLKREGVSGEFNSEHISEGLCLALALEVEDGLGLDGLVSEFLDWGSGGLFLYKIELFANGLIRASSVNLVSIFHPVD